MTVTRINHFNVCVQDMDAALDFWQGSLGLHLLGHGKVQYPHLDEIVGLRGAEIEWAELAVPDGGLIELFRYHTPTGEPVGGNVNDPGTTHLALEVTDLDQVVDRLRSRGVPVISTAPIEVPVGDWRGWRCVYVKEPNGVTVELLERPA